MKVVSLLNCSFADLLDRLNDQEHLLSVTTSTDSNGWAKRAAWNPVDVFLASSDDAKQTSEGLEQFTAQHQAKGNIVMGYLSYDFGCMMHDVTLTKDNDLDMPLGYAVAYSSWVEEHNNELFVHAAQPGFVKEVHAIIARSPNKTPTDFFGVAPKPVWTRAGYSAAFREAKDYICAGDVYQLNIAHRFEGTSNVSGLTLFRKIIASSSASMQSYLHGPDFEVISNSPERFILVNTPHIQTAPIKGTRPRGADPDQDRLQRDELLNSSKEQAELNMITDLMRNDLGSICRAESVTVLSSRSISAHPALWHASSLISGQLRPEYSAMAALIALMPGGSISGCPKKRAMQIIDQLEPVRRGIYTGAVFTINQHGALDSSIAIRTMVKRNSRVYLSAGGGIVYDSQEASEYKETLLKAQSFLGVFK